MRHFFECAASPEAIQGRTRIQMTCGTGQTLVFAMILSEDLRRNPGGRYVLFVPWRDMLDQVAADLRGFGLQVGLIGDDELRRRRQVDPHVEVIVCTFSSAYLLVGQQFRIKLIDEAHHLDRADYKIKFSRIIRTCIIAMWAAEFSATFQEDKSPPTLQYDLDTAVGDGLVAELVLNVVLLPSPRGDSSTGWSKGLWPADDIARLAAEQRREWAPMLLVYGTSRAAAAGAEALRARGLGAEWLHKKTESSKRDATKAALRGAVIEAICVAGLFTEGTLIGELRTVILVEQNMNSTRIKQVSMRPLCKHGSKIAGNFVVPMSSQASKEDTKALRLVLRPLAELSPQFEQSVRGQRPGPWLRVLGGAGGPVEEAEVLGRLAACLEEEDKPKPVKATRPAPDAGQERALDWLARCRRLQSWADQRVAKQGAEQPRLPRVNSSDVEERSLAVWLAAQRRQHRKGALTEEQVTELEQLQGLPPPLGEK